MKSHVSAPAAGAISAAIAAAFLTIHHGPIVGGLGGAAVGAIVAVIVAKVLPRGGPPAP
jgi:hypothetical protein